MPICKPKLFFISLLVSTPIFFLTSCSISKVETNNPTFSPVLLNRYLAEIELGKEQVSNNPHLAIEFFNSAIEKNFNRPEAFFGRGWAWLELKKYDLAIKDFDMALEADWSSQSIEDLSVGRAQTHLYRSLAGMGLLDSIDPKKEQEAWVMTLGSIYTDLEMAEVSAGAAGDKELIKSIIQIRYIFENRRRPEKQ